MLNLKVCSGPDRPFNITEFILVLTYIVNKSFKIASVVRWFYGNSDSVPLKMQMQFF